MATTKSPAKDNNRKACLHCRKTFHPNSVKRHELICLNLNKGDKSQESTTRGSPTKRIRLENEEEEEDSFEDIRSKLRSSKLTSTTTIGNNNINDNSKKEPVKPKSEKKEAVGIKIEKIDNVKLSQCVANAKTIKKDDLVCLLCDQPIQLGNLETHYKLSHKIGSNRKLNRKISSSSVQNGGVSGSQLDYSNKRFKCEICRKMFDNSMHWCHYKEHHNLEKVHRCTECNLVFSYVQNLLYHKSVEHLKEMYKSKYCVRKDRDKESQSGQVNSDHGGSVSSGSRSSNSSSSCNSISSNSPRSSIDSTSSSSYDDNNSHHRHSSRLEMDAQRKVNKYICPLDDINFNSIFDLLDHTRQFHHWTRENQFDPLFEPDLFCPECGLEFVVKPTLVKHLKVSHEDSLLKINVKAYMERCGYGSRPLLMHQCQVCFQVLDSQFSFNIHRRTHGLAFLSFLKSSM